MDRVVGGQGRQKVSGSDCCFRKLDSHILVNLSASLCFCLGLGPLTADASLPLISKIAERSEIRFEKDPKDHNVVKSSGVELSTENWKRSLVSSGHVT